MRLKRIALATLVFIALTAHAEVTARQKPNLSGTWKATKDAPSTVPAAPSAVLGEQFGTKIDGQSFTLLRMVRDLVVPATQSLDGSESRNVNPGRTCVGDAGFTTKAVWEGDAIAYTIVAALPAGGGAPVPSGLKYVLRLTSPDTLVVETTIRTSAGTAPTPVGTVYTRSADALKSSAEPNVTLAKAAISDVAWITGLWTGGTAPTSLEERWTAGSGGAMLGVSRTMRNGAMNAFEFLCIAERSGSLVYTAMPNAGPLTDFMLTKIDADSATFENPAHDFPKAIRYAKKPDGTLEATISGTPGQRATTFVFKKQQ